MPVPYEEEPTTTQVDDPVRGFRLRRREPWAIRQARKRHDEVLWLRGEYGVIALMWRVEDHNAGLVDRCPECWADGVMDPVADAYGQGSKALCPTCFGTTFDGGYKALIYRPTIWDVNEPSHEESRRGEVIRETASIQFTSDFNFRRGDYVFRADGTRWQIQTHSTNHLRTGFGITSPAGTALGWNVGQAVREDETAPAYLIPPDAVTLLDRLEVISGEYWPKDFAAFEDIRGPLL